MLFIRQLCCNKPSIFFLSYTGWYWLQKKNTFWQTVKDEDRQLGFHTAMISPVAAKHSDVRTTTKFHQSVEPPSGEPFSFATLISISLSTPITATIREWQGVYKWKTQTQTTAREDSHNRTILITEESNNTHLYIEGNKTEQKITSATGKTTTLKYSLKTGRLKSGKNN